MTSNNSADKTELLNRWRSSFGEEYLQRNMPTAETVTNTALALAQVWIHLDSIPETLLEVGANAGRNLRAIQRICGAQLFAVEPSAEACEILKADRVLEGANVHQATIYELPFADSSIDLVMTSGVLIHVPDDGLRLAYDELHRVSGRYLLTIEYFSPTPVSVTYRDHEDMLFKRDYGALWLDWYEDLEHVANGFFWQRTTGQGDVNWWLFRKR